MSLKLLKKINPIFYTGIVYIVIIVFVFIPFSVYSLRRLMSIKRNIIFQKRHGKISQVFVIISICLLTVGSHDILSRDVYVGGCEYVAHVGFHVFIINQHNWTLLSALFVLKVWLNYYDINYSKTIINNEWKSLIDPNITKSDRHNWFVKHRDTYGSERYLLKYLFLFCVTSLVVTYILFIMNYSSFAALCPYFDSEPTVEGTERAQSVLILIWLPARTAHVICYTLVIIIRNKTVAFEDNFYIRQEIKYIILAAVGYFAEECINMITQAVLFAAGMIPKNSASWGIVLRTIQNFTAFLSLVTLCIVIWIQTLWFMKKNKKWLLYFERIDDLKVASARDAVELRPLSLFNRKSNKRKTALSTFNIATIEDDNVEHMAQKETSAHSKTSLDAILNIEKGFSSFMYHLSYEFSVEILISILEFYQYKKYIYEHPLFIMEEKDSDDIKVDKYFNVFSNEYIPQSHIVYGDKENIFRDYHSFYTECIEKLQIANNAEEKEKFKLLFECMISSHQLFIKYIQKGARTEINISFTMRGILNNMFCGQEYRDSGTFHTELCGDEFSESDSFESFIEKRTQITLQCGILSEINTLYHVFDDCCEDMLKLIDYSFQRFRESTLFQKVLEHL